MDNVLRFAEGVSFKHILVLIRWIFSLAEQVRIVSKLHQLLL